MTDVPHEFGLYRDVVQRIGEFKLVAGKWLSFPCLFPERHKHGDRHWSGLAWVGYTGKLLARCLGCGAKWPEIVAAVGLPVHEWFPDKGKKFDRGGRAATPRRAAVSKIVATYDYRDPDGDTLYQKVRMEPKRFFLRRRLPAELRQKAGVPGAEEAWAWGLEEGWYGRHQESRGYQFKPVSQVHNQAVHLPHRPKVLYRLPEMLSADPRQPVLYVEGEKDADALTALGFVAVCGPGGASWWDFGLAADFAGRRLVVVPDNDGPGYSHARLVVGSAVWAGATSVRVVEWSDSDGLPAGGDVSDFIAGVENKRDSVVALCKRFGEYRLG